MVKLKTSATKQHLMSLKAPKATDSYSPVPHKIVIESTMEQLDKQGLKILTEDYSMGRDGLQAKGSYLISGSDDPDMGIKLLWHNSYDKSMSLKWAIGAEVFICENGMVRGDIGAFKRKHTGDALIEYLGSVEENINKAGDIFRTLVKDRERMKEIEVTKKTCAQLIGQLYIDESIITATQMNVIKREMENPSFKYNADGSLWQLYNHVTVALRDSPPLNYMKQHMQTHDFFTKEFQLC